jgi:multidrug transporter EmrE-like cation transporter
LTIVYPFTALTFVLVYLGGVLIYDEPTTPTALGGVALVLLGLYFIAVK